MAEELPLPDPAQPGTLCYTATSNTPGWCQPSASGGHHQSLPAWAAARLGMQKALGLPREAEGCSGLQEAHPQPGCQFYPKPHLQVWTTRYKNTKVATSASSPRIPVRFPSRATSGATVPTGPHVQDWEVWDSYLWVTTKTYWGKGILFHVYKNVNITVFYACAYYYLYIIIWLLYIHIYNPRIYRQCVFTSLYRLGEEKPLLLCNPPESPTPLENSTSFPLQEFTPCSIFPCFWHVYPISNADPLPVPRHRRPARGTTATTAGTAGLSRNTKCSQSAPKSK